MLFCSSMFGQQHWTMADNLDYSNTKLIIADIKIEGETPANMEDLEVAAFSNGVLRGVAKPAKVFNKYILRLTVHTNFNGEQINFKLYDPSANEGEGKEYDTDYTIKLLSNDQSFGTVVSPVEMNFYSMHWSYINVNDNYMAYPCIIKIDGVEQTNPNLELAAFINNELRGVARPKLEEAINIYIANLKIDGNNGQTISFKLYVPEVGELETDYTAIYDIDYDNGLVTLEFRNNPVAKIVRNEITHYFSSLEAAVAAAQDGETILLLQNVTLTETLTIEKSITIDGDGFEIKPADATKTYNSAIMVGNSGWGDDHGEVITLNNIKLNNWKTNYGVVRAQGVTLNMTACEFNGNDVSNDAYGVLSLNFTDATVTNSIFKQNQDRAIDINYNVGDNSTTNAEVTIVDCIFEENVSDGAGIVVRNKGEKLVVKDSKFLNNTVTTNGNAATIYAGWGTSDVITGCYFDGNNVTTSHATTKRFASAIFCDGCAVTGNAFGVNTATRNGEIITTTVAVGAYYGAANISENYWGGSAPVPGEDYTVEFTNNNVAINDYYKEYSEGTLSDKVTLNNVAKAGKYYYESITAAFAAVQDGETVTMLHDVNLSESIKVNNNITLDLNGKTITGTDNETVSFALFEVQPSKELTVKDENNTGKITLTATNNRGWNAYSSVISNQRGKLTVNGGTIEHLGGTDMAYGIDNLTNGKGTYAETIINGGTVKSLYRAIRQFLNGIEAQNILTINGGTIEGANKSIWMQSANANANPGKLTIVEGVTVKGNILLEAEPNATSWPVEVSIVASTLKDGAQVMTEDLPSGYELVLENGVYSVYHGVAKIGNNYYDDLSSALKAITSGCTLDILTDITITEKWDCRYTGAKIAVPVTINGNGKTIKFTGNVDDKNWNTLFRFEYEATVKNLTLDASAATGIQRGITFKKSVTVDNCTLIGNGTTAKYAVIVGEGAEGTTIGGVTANITNSTFINWIIGVTDNMNGQDMNVFAITGCTFDNTDVIISAYEKVTFTGNNMSSNSYVNITSHTVPNNVQVVANNNTNLAANTETECNQIAAPLANINAQDGFLTPVAEINGKYFTTLQAAINAAAEDETVKLLADVNYSLDPSTFTPKHGDDDAALFVLADDKLTIDLNGNTISVVATLPEGAATAHSGAIINNGDLTIDDSSVEKEGKVTFKYVGIYDEGYKRHGVVMNLGTLTVNAGTLENVTELQNQQAIDNTNYNKTEVSVVINGGTIKSAGYYAIDMVGYYDFEPALKNSVVINGGTIDGGVYARIQNNTNLSLNITGGVIKSDFAEAVRYRVYYPGNTHSISITGGEFSTTNAESQVVRVQLAEGESLAGFISAGTFSQDVNEFCAAGFMCVENDNGTYGVVVDPDYGKVAKIGETRYATLAAAFTAAAQTEELTTIELLPVTIEEGTVKLPATLKNVTVKGVEGAVLKDMTIMAADGNSINYEGITFDGVVFVNSNIVFTGWRTNESFKNLTVTNCIFRNIERTGNIAALHLNMDDNKPLNGLKFTNNIIDGIKGSSNSGIYTTALTGEVVIAGNVINNVSFRPFIADFTSTDGIADKFTVTGNTFSGSAAGRAQALTNNAEGTDEVELTVSNNIFKDITAAQQICYWNFNEATTTAILEKNYYDIDVVANPDRIYYNGSAQNISELSEMGIFPIYTELNADGTINEESLFDPVAYVDTDAFETLDEAVDEVTENNNTIVVIANVENVNHLIIPAGKNVVLDLNGKTISGVCNTSSEHNADLIEVENTATLTIKDSSENEEGKVTYASGTYKTGFTVDVKGNLILESGTIELTDSWSLGFAVDVRPNAWGTAYTEASTFVMNGGKVVSSDTGVRIDSNSGETNPSSRHGVYFTMNGGDIISDWDAIFIQHRYANDLYVNIAENAGTIQGKNSPLRIYGDGVVSDVEINIAGGTFDYTGDEGTTGWVVEKFLKATEAQVEAAKIEIKGGTFDADVSRFCAFNYVCTSNGDGTYGIEYKPQEEDAFVIETLHELEAFRDAVNAGNNFSGEVFKLKSNIDLNPTRAINNWEPIGTQANPFKGTFDGGDKTISNLVVDGGSYVGLFGYANEATIKNVKIENANVKGTDCVGVIAGSVYSKSTIENCHISGVIKVEGLTKVGGIHGYGYAKIVNSSVVGANDSYVKGTYVGPNQEGDNVGGIVGHGGEGNTIADCTVNNISVIGTRKVGGIVGTTDRAKVLDNCLVDGVVIENTAGASYANDNAATTTIGGLIGNYHGEGKDGSVKNCVVKNVTFNVGNAKNVGPIVGGNRTTPGAESIEGVTASGNLVYMSTITGSTNTYLMNAVAKIGETKYYTLQEAVDAGNGETINVIGNTTEVINIADNAVIDLNFSEGVTLNGYILAPNADLTINDGTISNTNSAKSAVQINAGKLELNNVNITSARHAMRIEGTNGEVIATINGGTYKLHEVASQTQHVLNAGGDGSQVTVTINNGTFVGPKGTASDSGSAVNVKSGSTVTINGGEFSGGKNHTLSAAGTLIVKGGTFDQVVNASHLAEGYVCQMNADNKYEVFFAVAKIGEVNYPSLQKAFNDVDANETITIISNVEESEVILPATLENVIVTAPENVVVKNTVIKTPEMGTTSGFAIAYEGLTFNNVNFDNSRVHLTGWANDALSQSVSIKNLVVTNCEFNNIANEENQNYAALHLNVADGVLENLTFTNNKVNGITGGESAALYGNFTGVVTITGNVIRNTSGSSMVVGYSNATINITDNILENWALSGKGRAIRLDVNNEANASTVEVSDNAMIHANAPEEFVKSTGSNTTVTLNENYWYGNSPREEGMVTAAGVVIDNYYKTCTVTNDDFELDNLVVYAKGTITHGYVNTYKIWGEGSSNSQVSFVVKVYAGETLLGQASLNDKDNIIDGDIPNVTWGIPYNTANTDEYWTVKWFEALSPSVVPTTVKLYVDGEFVAENTIKMSAPDDLNPIEWEDIFVAKIEEANTYFTSLQAAIDAADGKTVVVLDNITLTETVTVAAGTTVTLDLNGKNLTGGANVNLYINGELTIEDNVGNAVSTFRNHYVSEGGKLTLKSGILQNIETNTGGYGIFIENGGESIIEGGTVQAVNESNYAICVNGTLTIVDGNIVGKHGVIAVENPNAIVTIENGEYTLNAITGNSDHIVYVYAGMVNIEYGNFTFNNFIANEGDSMIYADKENVSITGGTYTHDVNNYCHKYYAAIQGDDNLWRVEQVLFAQTTALQGGWNWYSSYINLASDEELVEMQNAFDGKGLEIKGKTGFSDYQYIGDDENGVAQYKWYKTEDFSISAKQMYMIKTTEALDLVVDGKVVNPAANPISLKVGWNWIGYPMTENVAINVALENLEAEPGDVIKSRNGESEYIEGYGWYGDILTMEPGVGYKYYSQKRTTFVYNSTADNSRYVNENVTPDNNYWLPEVSQYADNMSIVAMLNIDGEIAKDNYEIAAFVNGECRGSARPVYIEALDVYVVFMMVFGEESEELSFKYYDVDYETEYELNDVITYCSDSRIGSVNNPYMFNLDILNIDESSVEDINIYPNPTTTGSEINLQAVCDKVEVFNALGVKVAEYTNVDSIDAIETAGVYVIRLTIDNSARNCRLIVK